MVFVWLRFGCIVTTWWRPMESRLDWVCVRLYVDDMIVEYAIGEHIKPQNYLYLMLCRTLELFLCADTVGR